MIKEDNERVGLFGGTFNPLHKGHINCIATVKNRLSLDRIMVVPAAQNPTKPPIEGPTAEQRLTMLERGLSEYTSFVKIDDQEIRRGGLSFTVTTVTNYSQRVAKENLYVIIGLDQFEVFDRWKDYEMLLSMTNLAVVTRTGFELPSELSQLAPGLQLLVEDFDRRYIKLKCGTAIEFIHMKEVDVSASEVRKRLRTGMKVEEQLTFPVEEYIREEGLYRPSGPKIADDEAFTRFCAGALFDKKAINVRAFDLRSLEAPADFTLIASGTSTRHASALAEAVQRAAKSEYGVSPQSVEGTSEGRWILLDYGSLIVHVFYDFARQEYRLEELWKAGEDLHVVDESIH